MSDVGELRFSGLRIRAPETWTFHEFGNLVLARPDSSGGSLQLTTAFLLDCREAPTPECCEAAAREWLGDTLTGPFHVTSVGEGADSIGGANIGPDGQEGRAWYVLRGGSLLLAIYRWASDGKREPGSLNEMKEAELIVRSVSWDSEGTG